MRPSALQCLAVFGIIAATFPWDLQDHAHWSKVAWTPFATGIVRPLDLFANVLLYVPLGYLLATRGGRPRILQAGFGALLLASLTEFAQVWSHSRFPSATDITMNVLGAVAGAAVAYRHQLAIQRRGSPESLSA